jgi:oxygen-dependent protoporphyrinogen oxidase
MIAIIGGGITGLTLAHHLSRRGVPYTVFEASERPGGVIRSARVGGHLLEWGPQRARLSAAFRALVEEVGLAGELLLAPRGLPLYVYRRGRLRPVPFSPGGFLRTDLLSRAAKLRLLLEPFSGRAREQESVADYLRRKLGREAYQELAGPLYGGLYASDPDEMLMGLSLGPLLRELGVGRSLLLPLLRRGGKISPPAACSFREGLQALPDALYHAHREQLRLSAPVERVLGAGTGFLLEVAGDAMHASAVVVTAPAPAAARLLAEIAPEASAAVATLRYNPLGIVHLHARTELSGLGYQTSLAETLYTRGVTFNDSLFARTGVYTAFLGGARAPEVVSWSDDRIGETAAREFRAVTGYEAEVLSVSRQQMPAWDRSWAALRGISLPPGIHLAASWESRPGIPGRLAQAERLAERLARENS